MRHRGLRSVDEERTWQESVLRGSYLPFEEALAHRMAQHAARVAWAEVEYAAWIGGNCIGLPHQPIDYAAMDALLRAAYLANERERAAHIALRTAEAR